MHACLPAACARARVHVRRKVNRSVPEKTAWQWLVQLLLSLSYTHSKRILHRQAPAAGARVPRASLRNVGRDPHCMMPIGRSGCKRCLSLRCDVWF